jgi:hypothetical protein
MRITKCTHACVRIEDGGLAGINHWPERGTSTAYRYLRPTETL